MPLTREQYTARTKLPIREVTLWDGATILVRKPSGLEWDEFDFDAPHYRSRLVCQFAIDEKGARLFKDEDINKIVLLGADDIEEPTAAIMEMSGATRKAVKELAKNLRKMASGDSSTGSPATSG